jgi:hypothetical protein
MHKRNSGAVWNYEGSFCVFISGFDSHSRRHLIAYLITCLLLYAPTIKADESKRLFSCSGLVVKRESGNVQQIFLDDMLLDIGHLDAPTLLTSKSNIQISQFFPMQINLMHFSNYENHSDSIEWSYRHELLDKNKIGMGVSKLRIERITGKLTLRSVMHSGATLAIDGYCR